MPRCELAVAAFEPFLKSVSLRREFVPSFGEYPFSIPAVRKLDSLSFLSPVTFFIGENGTGKTTLLQAIALAEGFDFEGGSRNFTVRHDDARYALAKALTIGKGMRRARNDSFFLKAESFYKVSAYIDQLGFDPTKNPYGPIPLGVQSHGESFLTMFVTRFSGNGLYLLDEPEAALSPQRQLTFLAAIHELVQKNSQLIIATHSPILMAYPGATIYEFTDEGIRKVNYEETEHYRVTKNFLLRTEQTLKELFSED